MTTDLIRDHTYRTTYKENYQYDGFLPPILYNQHPCFQLSLLDRDGKVTTVPRRDFPLIPSGPKRRFAREPATKVDITLLENVGPKPIVQGKFPREIINLLPRDHVRQEAHTEEEKQQEEQRKRQEERKRLEILPLPPDIASRVLSNEVLDAICDDVTWTSTTRQATDEAKLPRNEIDPPRSTFEKNSDLVRDRVQKYDSEPAVWQEVAGYWDRAQLRPPIDNIKETRVSLRPSRLQPRRKHDTNRQEVVNETITELVRTDKLATPFIRQCPGYAGFVPRSVIKVPYLEKKPKPYNHPFTSVMQMSYKPFHPSEYNILKNAHKGPMSRTVTLTYPYNPFNKLEKRNDSGEIASSFV